MTRFLPWIVFLALLLGALAATAEAGDARRVVGVRRLPTLGSQAARAATAPRRTVQADERRTHRGHHRAWDLEPCSPFDLYEHDTPAPEPVVEVVIIEVEVEVGPPLIYEAEDFELSPDHGSPAYVERQAAALARLKARAGAAR